MLLLFATALKVGGCALTLNQTYQRLDHVPEGKAVVYIYRTPFVGGAFAVDVTANGVPVNSIHTSTYYPYVAAPGMVEFTANALLTPKETLSVFLKPGASYYLKIVFVPRTRTEGAHLKPLLVPEGEAEQELADCKLLREPGQ
jgi:hypothetical protein